MDAAILSRNDASTLLPSGGQRLINARDLTNCLLFKLPVLQTDQAGVDEVGDVQIIASLVTSIQQTTENTTGVTQFFAFRHVAPLIGH